MKNRRRRDLLISKSKPSLIEKAKNNENITKKESISIRMLFLYKFDNVTSLVYI